MLARRYFQEAVTLGPSDARTLGFLAGHTLAEGTLHKDERLTRHADSPRFRDGLGWQWEALDIRPLHAWVSSRDMKRRDCATFARQRA
jgi:hypothetical protein